FGPTCRIGPDGKRRANPSQQPGRRQQGCGAVCLRCFRSNRRPVDARLVLSGQNEVPGTRPDIFMALKGPLPDVSYNIDVSALTGWLTLRAVENQTKRLRAIELVPQQPATRPVPKVNPAPPLPAPTDVKPAPKPRSVGRPAASVGTQN